MLVCWWCGDAGGAGTAGGAGGSGPVEGAVGLELLEKRYWDCRREAESGVRKGVKEQE